MLLRSGRIIKHQKSPKQTKMGNLIKKTTTIEADVTVEIEIPSQRSAFSKFSSYAVTLLAIIGGCYALVMLYQQFFTDDKIVRADEIVEIMFVKKKD